MSIRIFFKFFEYNSDDYRASIGGGNPLFLSWILLVRLRVF